MTIITMVSGDTHKVDDDEGKAILGAIEGARNTANNCMRLVTLHRPKRDTQTFLNLLQIESVAVDPHHKQLPPKEV